MKPWMKEFGLTQEGAARAEEALPIALKLVEACGDDNNLAFDVLREALFRVLELPRRTKEYQRAYLERNK